ncbi:hypothetical protein V2J09_021811 [Rumex salicifolius]
MMPTFTAVALERFLEPRDSKLERSNSTPGRTNGAASLDSRPVPVPHRKPSVPLPPPHPNAVRRNSSSSTTTAEKEKAPWPQISPGLYSTPESTPLPDSPTLLSPSPYLINHKRRGPRLQKSFSEDDVLKAKMVDEIVPSSSDLSGTDVEAESFSLVDDAVAASAQLNSSEERKANGLHQENIENGVVFQVNGETKDLPGPSSVEKESEIEDFYDPQESMSVTSNTDGEDFGADLSARAITPGGVFYDAWDDLSSDSGRVLHSLHDFESELREMKLSLLMEVEKRKQAEDTLNSMQSQWQRLREGLRKVGLVLPTNLSTVSQDSSVQADFTEDIRQQIFVTRFVSESLGDAAARAECEEEMQAQLESKNFEIARLCDRLHYYETMNREMSQRNQETIELARRDRHRRNRMQMWVWGSIATAVTLGSVALAWSYIPNGGDTSSSSSQQLNASEIDASTE